MSVTYMDIERAKALAGWSFLRDHKIVAPKMLVKGLLPYTGIAFIGGQSGAGKTFIADDLAVALGSASPFFGRVVKERVGVAIIAAEGVEQAGNRLTAAALARGLDINDLPIAWRGGLPLKSAADVDKLGKQLHEIEKEIREQYGVRLGVSILDTVAATLDMEDEDSNSEVAKGSSSVSATASRSVSATIWSGVPAMGRNWDAVRRHAYASRQVQDGTTGGSRDGARSIHRHDQAHPAYQEQPMIGPHSHTVTSSHPIGGV
jgi:AAA domain